MKTEIIRKINIKMNIYMYIYILIIYYVEGVALKLSPT